MEKLLAILTLMAKFKTEKAEYLHWDKENPGIFSSEQRQNLLYRILEIDKISERIKIIIQNLNLKNNSDSDELLKKIDVSEACKEIGENSWQIPTMKKSFKPNDGKKLIESRVGLKTDRFRCN
jgi:hypothetical protein